MSAAIVFEDPPERNHGGPAAGQSAVGLWLAELRQHPNTWARYPALVWAASGTHIRRGGRYGVKPGEFEVRTVGQPDTYKVSLYARYIGGES